MGVAQGSTGSRCSMEIDWLEGLRSMWQNYFNLLSSWNHSISKLVGTKLIWMFNGWFWKPIDVVIGVSALALGKWKHGVINRHGCCAKTISSNG
jgi:hypothetical protein